MVTDLLRSHQIFKAEIATVAGHETWIRYYPCAPGAQAYPGWCAFGNPVWEDKDSFAVVIPGMERQPEIWRGKRYPAPAGVEFHGPAEWIESGIPPDQLDALPDLAADCCGRRCRQAWGGVSVGGRAMPAVIACRVLSTLLMVDNDFGRVEGTGWQTDTVILPDNETVEAFDTGGFISTDQPDRVSIPATGYYLLSLELALAGGSAYPAEWRIQVYRNTDDTDPVSYTSGALTTEPVASETVEAATVRTILCPLDAGDYLRVYVSLATGGGPETLDAQIAVNLLLLGTTSPPGPGPSGTFGVPGKVIDTITVLDGAVQAVDSADLSPAEISGALDSLGGITTSD